MKIFYSATSPYVRKCLICAHELGLFDRLEPTVWPPSSRALAVSPSGSMSAR